MKTKPNSKRFGGTFGTIKFDEKLFFHTLLNFEAYWDYEPTNAIHADSPCVYNSDKILNLSTMDKIQMKCDCADGSVVNGLRRPILFSFVLDKPIGIKIICEPETIHFKKTKKSVLKTISRYLQDDNQGEVDFNGETITSRVQMIEI